MEIDVVRPMAEGAGRCKRRNLAQWLVLLRREFCPVEEVYLE